MRRISGAPDYERVLTKYVDDPQARTLEFYRGHDGYETARKTITDLPPAEVTERVKASNLRGRGGAGFPCGLKWTFVPKDSPRPTYLVVNADESEPGTFKARIIMEQDPPQLIEGIIISAWALECHVAYVYIRGEYFDGFRIMNEAIRECYDAGILGDDVLGTGFQLDLTMHRGAGAYICGEETGLLSSLEGQRGNPKIKPPFPAVEGLFRCPTVVNNVETIACVTHILERGVDWFTGIGPESGPGPKLIGISGHVEKPGAFEVPMGFPLLDAIELAGGVWKGRKLKAAIPGGSSAPVLTAEECDVAMDYDAIAAKGSMFGSGGIIVMDETTDMVDALYNLLRFYSHESCGQCTPCREGTGWLTKICGRICAGEGRPEDPDLMLDLCDRMVGRTICVLADAAAFPCRSFIGKFRDEFDEQIRAGKKFEREVFTGGPLVQPGAISAHNQERLQEARGHGH